MQQKQQLPIFFVMMKLYIRMRLHVEYKLKKNYNSNERDTTLVRLYNHNIQHSGPTRIKSQLFLKKVTLQMQSDLDFLDGIASIIISIIVSNHDIFNRCH
mmetsp:Transcript_26477/g.32651  ORF Transcript_26477/g.32651 Transcript_26477/m.32651 type:complete len:100 (+) Transcript_26477:1648-1947(+)